MRKLLVTLASVSLLFGGVSVSSPAQAAPVAPHVLTAAEGNNILGKPLPKLDYAHASKATGSDRRKAKPSTVSAPRLAPRTSCGTCLLYGGGRQTVSTDAATINFSVEQPSCTTFCYHSLAENAVESADGQQVVEWGWTVDTTGVNGADHVKPHLFAFRWVNGVPGVYNGSGYVNAVGSLCPAGMDISADVSVASANTYNFAVQHLNGAWWFAYKTNWCGAYPDAVWTGATPPVTYTQAGLVQIFGEVAVSDNAPTGVKMGSGVLGANGPTAGAKASSFGLGPNTLTAPSLTIFNTPSAPTHYNAVLTSPSVRTFRYGGTW